MDRSLMSTQMIVPSSMACESRELVHPGGPLSSFAQFIVHLSLRVCMPVNNKIPGLCLPFDYNVNTLSCAPTPRRRASFASPAKMEALIDDRASIGDEEDDESFDEETGEVRQKSNGAGGGRFEDSSEEEDDDDDEAAAAEVSDPATHAENFLSNLVLGCERLHR
jgi:hypothetical protein